MTILLDTDVISEMMKPVVDSRVLAWFASHDGRQMISSTIVEAEILAGLEVMPNGRRRASLELAAANFFSFVMQGRVVPFDRDCARIFSELNARRQFAGRPLARIDGLIAATAKAHGARLATRNAADFDGLDLDLVNPWESPA